MMQLAEKGKPIDLVSVAKEVGPDHFFEIGGGGYFPLSPPVVLLQQISGIIRQL